MRDLAARRRTFRDLRFLHTPEDRRRVGAAYAVGLLGAGLTAVVIATVANTDARVPPSDARPTTIDRSADAVLEAEPGGPSTHVNELGGYSFEAPAGWVIRDRGSASRLTSPDEDVVMSFGVGRPGSLEDAVEALVASIRRVYGNVRVGAPQQTEVHRDPAVAISGILENAAGVPVRFLGLAIRLDGENRLVSVFVSQPADAAEVLPALDQVIGSLGSASGA